MLLTHAYETSSDGDWATATTAWLALVLAVVGLIVQIFTRHLDGGRLRVRLHAVFLPVFEGGGIMTLGDGRWPVDRNKLQAVNPDLRDPISKFLEVAELVIENRGRTAATVFDVGLQWLEPRRRPFARREPHHVMPRIFVREGFGTNRYVGAASGVRLEPYDQVTILVDYWSTLDPGRRSPGGFRRIRGAARVAGSSRMTLSSRRTAWKIPDAAVSAVSNATTLPLLAVVNRAIFGVIASDGIKIAGPGYFARSLAKELSKGEYPPDPADQIPFMQAAFEAVKYPQLLEDDEDAFAKMRVEFVVQWTVDRYRDVIDWPYQP